MKNTLQKKVKSNHQFVIASAGKTDCTKGSVALHANLSDSNGSEALTLHYKELINKGLVAQKVELVVTDMLPAYQSVISTLFVNALHQFCIFHLMQQVNKALKKTLKEHRRANYLPKNRKQAHKISFLMLKGEEKLTKTEREKVLLFCEKHPELRPNYAFKEDLRTLYATAQNPAQAYAYKDILDETYLDKMAKTMKKVWTFIKKNFEKTIAYLRTGYRADKTNNDAERMMKMIKRTQRTHYFIRKSHYYLRKIKVVLGIQKPVAT